MFGRATITLGIGPHSSMLFDLQWSIWASGVIAFLDGQNCKVSISSFYPKTPPKGCEYRHFQAKFALHCLHLQQIPLRIHHKTPFQLKILFLWSPYVIGETIIFLPCDFYLLSFFFLFFLSSPNLSRHRLDVCHTSTHGLALVRI